MADTRKIDLILSKAILLKTNIYCRQSYSMEKLREYRLMLVLFKVTVIAATDYHAYLCNLPRLKHINNYARLSIRAEQADLISWATT